jgi:four helix bundle protein
VATVQQFEDLKVWQDARDVVKEVYRMTNERPFRRDFSLREQMTRAAISTMSNIAEGFEHGSRKEFIRFLNIAKASNGEVRSQLYVAWDQKYIDEVTFESSRALLQTLSRRLSRFIGYLQLIPGNSRCRLVTPFPSE